MIRFILLQNRQGKTRLAKYYVPLEDSEKHKVEYEVHRLVVNRDPKFTNFVEVCYFQLLLNYVFFFYILFGCGVLGLNSTVLLLYLRVPFLSLCIFGIVLCVVVEPFSLTYLCMLNPRGAMDEDLLPISHKLLLLFSSPLHFYWLRLGHAYHFNIFGITLVGLSNQTR
uniref:Uncharacterized protein MANES_05G147900 n=1 Tax=Rhizophora mucronata TaxID=61149 RepID=A0A2P2MID5_RHIMU